MMTPPLPPYTLTGAPRIVKQELEAILAAGFTPSISLLARQTGYNESTVRRALVRLHELGLIRYQCYRNGCRARYEVLE